MLYITSDKPVRDMQREFTEAFPFLKLEFFIPGSAARRNVPTELFLTVKIEQGNHDKAENRKILLTPFLTAKELTKKCEEVFGVTVKVYRRFSNLWLETSITENFTLQQQNDHVSEILASATQ